MAKAKSVGRRARSSRVERGARSVTAWSKMSCEVDELCVSSVSASLRVHVTWDGTARSSKEALQSEQVEVVKQ
jgi:hypothetical protein